MLNKESVLCWNEIEHDLYEENGYVIGENLVVTFETKQTILTTRKIQTVIERYLRRHRMDIMV